MPRFTFLSIVVLLVAPIMWGCDDLVSIEVPRVEPTLAVYSFVNPDSTWEVSVYRTARPDEQVTLDDVAVADALVRVTGETGVDTLAHAGGGRYVNQGRRPAAGAAYTISVSAEGLPSATAADSVPERPAFSLRSERGEQGPFFVPFRLTITLDDPEGANWYRIALYRRLSDGGGNEAWAPAFFSSGEPFLRASAATVGSVDIEASPEEYDAAFFDDATFDGDSVEVALHADLQLPVGQVYVVLTSMSESYFQYHRTLALQKRNEGDPLSDPVSIQGNIRGGFGVFGGYADATRMVQVN